MEPINLSDVKDCIRWIDPKLRIPARVLSAWIKKVDSLLPKDIREDQIEYVIAAELKKNKLESTPSVKAAALALLLLKIAFDLKETIFAEDLASQVSKENIESEEVLKELGTFLTHLNKKKYQLTVRVHPQILPLLIDQVLRWVTLYFGASGIISYTEFPFIILQAVVIPAITLTVTYFINKRNIKHNQRLLSRLEMNEKINLKLVGSSAYYFFLAVIVGVAVIIGITVWGEADLNPPIFIAGVAIFAWILFLSVYQNMAYTRVNEQHISVHTEDVVDFSNSLDSDENDDVIVKIREQLSSLVGRLDAYILESALFGALAFSGFLQIMAENLVSFQNLEDFASNILNIIQGIILFKPDMIDFSFLQEKSALFSLVSVETLVCSLLFLGVIASRLRFSNIADQVRYHLATAAAFNQKEELIIHQHHKPTDAERADQINAKIHQELFTAQNLLLSMNSITSFMRFLRSGGLLVFLIILISSALLISGFLSLIFIFFSIAVFIYFNRYMLNERLRSVRFGAQYIVLNYSHYFIISSILLYLLATITSIYLKWGYHLILINIAFLLFFLYRVIFVFMIPFPEDKYYKGNLRPPNWVKFLWGVGEILLIFGYFLFISNYPGAGVLIALGMTLSAVGVFLIGLQFSMHKLSGLVMGGSLASAFLFLGWRTLALPGNAFIFFISILLGVVSFIIFFVNRSSYHRSIVSLLAGILILGLYFFTGHRYHRMAMNLRTTDTAYVKEVSENLRDIYFFEVFDDMETYNQTMKVADRLLNDQNLDGTWIRSHFAINMSYNIEVYIDGEKPIEKTVITSERASLLLAKSIALDSASVYENADVHEFRQFIKELPE